MAYSVKVQLRDHYIRKDGKTNFKLSIYLDGKRKFYPIDVYIEPRHWNGTKISATHPRNKEYNQILRDNAIRAEDAILRMIKNNDPLSFQRFETFFFEKQNSGIYSIEKAFDSYVDYYSGTLGKGSIKIYGAEKTKLIEFAGSNFPLSNIDEAFYMKFRKYLIDTKKNSQNTIVKALKKLKAVINFSIKMGYLKENKLHMVTEREFESNRASLEVAELDELEALFKKQELSNKLKDVLIAFLFSCYTSIRFSDISLLTCENIEGTFICFTPQKTKNETDRKIVVPITPRAQSIIDRFATIKEGEPLFRTISNQKANDYLTILLERANIKSKITFHCARHTFAMTALNFGMEMEYLQKIMGHSKIATTEIYGKYKKAILLEMSNKYLDF